MATTLAACELSGYSKSNHTFLWFSLVGSGFSSSLIKPSSSLCVLSKSNWNFISLALSFIFCLSSTSLIFLFFSTIKFLIDCDWLISIHTNHSSNMSLYIHMKTNSTIFNVICVNQMPEKTHNKSTHGILAISFLLDVFENETAKVWVREWDVVEKRVKLKHLS